MTKPRKVFIEVLSPLLAHAGFKWNQSRGMFIREEQHGFSALAWGDYKTLANGGTWVIEPVIEVRHDVIENIVNQLGLVYGEDNQRFTTTVSRPLCFFPFEESKGERHYIRMACIEADAERAASNVALMMAEHGAGFFRKYASVLECSQGLNDVVETTTHRLCNNFPLRAYYGLACAFLSEPERVETLAQRYLSFASSRGGAHEARTAARIDRLVEIARMSACGRKRTFLRAGPGRRC